MRAMWTLLPVVLHYGAVTFIVVRVLTRPRLDPSVRLAWIMVVEVLPIVGILVYLLFGEVRIAQADRQKARDIRARLSDNWVPSPDAISDPPAWVQGVTATAFSVGGMNPVGGNTVSLLPETDDAFDPMIDAIDGARDHIHVLFYIWLDDNSGRRIAESLVRAARRGVTCRVAIDAVGSRKFAHTESWTQMEAAGVRLARAMPTGLSPLRALTRRLDLRNHRKIVLIDNQTGFTGSHNASDMAFRVKAKFAPWVDVWFRVEGPAVRQMQSVFLSDWMNCAGEDLGDQLLATVPATEDSGVVAQVIPTGPDMRAGTMSDCMVALLAAARENVIITTPYYVPDSSLDTAICSCARRGVKVTLILPERNDSVIVGATSEGFYSGLLRAGVRLMLFRDGLLHAKLATIDDRLAMMGSANLDRRSFDLNYEMNVLLSGDIVADINERQQSYIKRSRELSAQEVADWPTWRRIRNNTFALASPLL